MLTAPSTIIEEACSGSGYEVIVGNSVFNETHPSGTELLTANNGCDSLVYVDLTFSDTYNTLATYFGCKGDGYDTLINETLYNEQHPNGIETITTVNCCDSIITVAMSFSDVENTNIFYEGCKGDGYSLVINGTPYNESNPSGLEIM